MKYTNEKKRAIVLYILDKISSGVKGLSNVVAEAFSISPNTVHTYLNDLLDQGIIKKVKRGEYELVTKRDEYMFSRSKGELNTDSLPFDLCLKEKINHLSEDIQHIWDYAMGEMVNNVIDHSAAEHMNVIVEQNHLQTSVLIIDDGVGIFEKIKKHFSFSSLDEAICELFKGKLTTDEANHSGEGIFFTSKMMDKFLIYSIGKIFTTSKYNNDNIFDMDEILNGTCVFMSLSNFSHKSAREVFNLYSDVDGGFTTTKIPLKNIFDSAPISRSQAKRICNRLEKFEEVILDFDGVSWMGQGFAHQMFIVYNNSNPNISIKPINMSEDVERMYKHVINTR